MLTKLDVRGTDGLENCFGLVECKDGVNRAFAPAGRASASMRLTRERCCWQWIRSYARTLPWLRSSCRGR